MKTILFYVKKLIDVFYGDDAEFIFGKIKSVKKLGSHMTAPVFEKQIFLYTRSIYLYMYYTIIQWLRETELIP